MWQILLRGGWMMLPLVICSLVAVTIIIDRFLFFRRISAPSRSEEVIVLAKRGRVEEALTAASEKASGKGPLAPVMNILSAGMTNLAEPAGAMESAGISELSSMKRGLVALDTIITLSPLLGLLGTIIGMIDSFQIMAVAGLGQPHAVTGGIAEALICTAAGITVAIITLIPYNYFLARVEREADIIEIYATRLEMALNSSSSAKEG